MCLGKMSSAHTSIIHSFASICHLAPCGNEEASGLEIHTKQRPDLRRHPLEQWFTRCCSIVICSLGIRPVWGYNNISKRCAIFQGKRFIGSKHIVEANVASFIDLINDKMLNLKNLYGESFEPYIANGGHKIVMREGEGDRR